MKKKAVRKIVVGLGILLGIGGIALAKTDKAEASTLYRAYNPNTGEHLYTQNSNEIPFVVRAGWRNEGTAWEAPSKGTPVYRMFNPNRGGDHHYTVNTNEVNMLKSKGWRYEGVSWQSGGSTPVYRLYNKNARSGAHHFTTLAAEKNNLVSKGWRYEGVAFYSGKDNNSNNNNNNNVTPNLPNLEKEISQKTLVKINELRAASGIAALGSNPVLDSAAAVRANDMYTNYDHVRPDGTEFWKYIENQAGYNQFGTAVGENIIAVSYRSDSDNADKVATTIVENWKKSPGHRANMESKESNEGAVGIKLRHTGSTRYDVKAVFVSGKNRNK